MRFTDKFKGAYLRAADLAGKTRRVTITNVAEEEIDGIDKVTLEFRELSQRLVLNKTNATILFEAHGDEMQNWEDQPILLKPDKTTFQGKLVACIRVEPAPKKSTPITSPSPAQATPPAPVEPGQEETGEADDEV